MFLFSIHSFTHYNHVLQLPCMLGTIFHMNAHIVFVTLGQELFHNDDSSSHSHMGGLCCMIHQNMCLNCDCVVCFYLIINKCREMCQASAAVLQIMQCSSQSQRLLQVWQRMSQSQRLMQTNVQCNSQSQTMLQMMQCVSQTPLSAWDDVFVIEKLYYFVSL